MHPDLFSIGPLTVRTYGLAMAASLLMGFWFSARRGSRMRIDPELVLDSFLPMFIGLILGARLFYIFTDVGAFIKAPLEILKIWRGGLVWYGGFIGGMVGVYLFTRLRKMNFWGLMDLSAPYVGLGYAVHRTFGCFGGFGCCYGKPTDLPFPIGVVFPEGSPASLQLARVGYEQGHAVFATQLFEAAIGLTIMAIIMIVRRKPHRIGQPAGIFFIVYSVLRFGNEFLRGDIYRGFYGSLSTSQWISIPLLILGIVLLFRKSEIVTPLSKEEAKSFLDELLEKEKEATEKDKTD